MTSETTRRLLELFPSHSVRVDADWIVEARNQYFRAIKQVGPEVLSALYNDVFPAFKSLCPSQPAPVSFTEETDVIAEASESGQPSAKSGPDPFGCDYIDSGMVMAVMVTPSGPLYYPHFADVRELFDRWAEKFKLEEEWCRVIAVETLFKWLNSGPTADTDLDWEYNGRFPIIEPLYTHFEFKFEPWNPLEPWSLYSKRRDEAYKAETKKYKQEVKLAAAAEAKAIGTRKQSGTQHHYDWLVEYQINGREVSDIALSYLSDPPTVDEALKSTARTLGLKLRDKKHKPTAPPRE